MNWQKQNLENYDVMREVLPICVKEHQEELNKKAEDFFSTKRKYSIIYLDIPWKHQKERHELIGTVWKYPTMTDEEIIYMPIPGLARKDCVILMWCVWWKYELAVNCIRFWGFNLHGVFHNWVKTNKHNFRQKISVGYHSTGNSEYLLVATRGIFTEFRSKEIIKSILFLPDNNPSIKEEIKKNIL